MKYFAAIALLASGASAFAPSAELNKATALSSARSDLEVTAKELNPLVGYYDPMGLADVSFWDLDNEATVGFLRQAEVKHGRVAMAAFVGYCVQSNFHWPGRMSFDGSGWPSTDLSPEQQWDALPDLSKWQIILFVGFLEWYGEQQITANGDHYTAGGKPGLYPSFDFFGDNVHPIGFNLYDPFNLHKNDSEERKARGRIAEINNGRLAMLGIFGFLSADTIEGSVPGLKDIAIPYDGNCMAPFA